jgi:hypothetical protein
MQQLETRWTDFYKIRSLGVLLMYCSGNTFPQQRTLIQ